MTAAAEQWIPTKLEYPKPGQRVEWLDPNDGGVVKGFMAGKLWHMDGGMYVYYVPTFWRPAT